jgi:hypothetical protein
VTNELEGMDFQVLGEWNNPMESELYPAALREREIPHRTRRGAEGQLIVEVPAEWLGDARETVERATRVFFGDPPAQPRLPKEGGDSVEAGEEEDDDDEDEEDDEDAADAPAGPFSSSDGLPSVEALRLRREWVARALAAVPGLGFGHLYAGQFKAAVFLFLATAFSVALFIYSGSFWSLLLGIAAWAVDMALAPGYVRDENQRALRARHKVDEKEREFLASLGEGDQDGRH